MSLTLINQYVYCYEQTGAWLLGRRKIDIKTQLFLGYKKEGGQ